jgi:hypothetical protein
MIKWLTRPHNLAPSPLLLLRTFILKDISIVRRKQPEYRTSFSLIGINKLLETFDFLSSFVSVPKQPNFQQ